MHLLHIFFVSHIKWTRQILYVVIYFFCIVFLTIHTLIYVITFVLCHHLYLDVCVSTSTEFIKIACILLYKISNRKLQIMKFFLCCIFYSTKNISKTCIAFLAHLAKGYVSFCHHLSSVNFSHLNLLL